MLPLLSSTLGETYHLNMARATAGLTIEGAIGCPSQAGGGNPSSVSHKGLISLGFEDCDYRYDHMLYGLWLGDGSQVQEINCSTFQLEKVVEPTRS